MVPTIAQIAPMPAMALLMAPVWRRMCDVTTREENGLFGCSPPFLCANCPNTVRLSIPHQERSVDLDVIASPHAQQRQGCKECPQGAAGARRARRVGDL